MSIIEAKLEPHALSKRCNYFDDSVTNNSTMRPVNSISLSTLANEVDRSYGRSSLYLSRHLRPKKSRDASHKLSDKRVY